MQNGPFVVSVAGPERRGRGRQRGVGDGAVVVLRVDLPLSGDLVGDRGLVDPVREKSLALLYLSVPANMIVWVRIR